MSYDIDLPPNFNERVWKLVRHIPAGKVLSYGRVAQLLEVPQGARAVGWAMSAANTVVGSAHVPWQRVVNSQGKISTSQANGTAQQQKALLEAEGVRFEAGDTLKIVGFNAILWQPSAIEVQHILSDSE